MSTTLTNGLKLPDKGSVDWYADMQSNYTILDGAVGTIAEHTTALAGKAPLVHTHSKSDITDFPVYGTTAGTICEGNDSRLSDARTPVAHTHGKADITDLFTSANTWAEGQTIYSYANIQSQVLERAVTPASTAHVSFNLRDKNNHDLGMFRSLTYSSSGNSIITVFGVTQIKDGQVDPTGTVDTYGFTETCKSDGTKYFTFDGYMGSNLVPLSVNQSIGSSSYQWDNLYANNYYYKGTAWGLDKSNTWSKCQNFAGEYQGTEASNKYHTVFAIYSKYDTLGKSGMLFTKWRENKAQGALTSSDLVQIGIDVLENEVRTNHVFNIQAGVFDSETGLCNTCNVISRMANANLGTSSYKWKTLNGINPGALSLPSSYYVEIGTDGWDLSGATYNRVYINNANPTFPGILFIRINSTTLPSIIVKLFSASGAEIAYSGNKIEAANNNMIITVPCPPSTNIYVSIKTSSTIHTCRYYTLLGDPEFDSRSGS